MPVGIIKHVSVNGDTAKVVKITKVEFESIEIECRDQVYLQFSGAVQRDPHLLCADCGTTVPKSQIPNHQKRRHVAGGELCKHGCGTNAGESDVPVQTHYASNACKQTLDRKKNSEYCLKCMVVKNSTHSCKGVLYEVVYKLAYNVDWKGRDDKNDSKKMSANLNSGAQDLAMAGKSSIAIANYILATGKKEGEHLVSRPLCKSCRDTMIVKKTLPLIDEVETDKDCHICKRVVETTGAKLGTPTPRLIFKISIRHVYNHFNIDKSGKKPRTANLPPTIDPENFANYAQHVQKGYVFNRKSGLYELKNQESVVKIVSDTTGVKEEVTKPKPAEKIIETEINGDTTDEKPQEVEESEDESDDEEIEEEEEDSDSAEEIVVDTPPEKKKSENTSVNRCSGCNGLLMPGSNTCYRCERKEKSSTTTISAKKPVEKVVSIDTTRKDTIKEIEEEASKPFPNVVPDIPKVNVSPVDVEADIDDYLKDAKKKIGSGWSWNPFKWDN